MYKKIEAEVAPSQVRELKPENWADKLGGVVAPSQVRELKRYLRHHNFQQLRRTFTGA